MRFKDVNEKFVANKVLDNDELNFLMNRYQDINILIDDLDSPYNFMKSDIKRRLEVLNGWRIERNISLHSLPL